MMLADAATTADAAVLLLAAMVTAAGLTHSVSHTALGMAEQS